MCTDLKDIATIIGVILAVFTLLKALVEYRQQGRQKRADAYIALERSFWAEPENRKITELLVTA